MHAECAWASQPISSPRHLPKRLSWQHPRAPELIPLRIEQRSATFEHGYYGDEGPVQSERLLYVSEPRPMIVSVAAFAK